MKCQSLFSGKNSRNINLSFAELAQSVVKVQLKSKAGLYMTVLVCLQILIFSIIFPFLFKGKQSSTVYMIYSVMSLSGKDSKTVKWD